MKKKNLIRVTALCVAGVLALGGCAQQGEKDKQEGDQVVLKVGASPSPHGEILQQAAPILEKEGIKLEIREFTDYILPNQALESGELDANFFQHKPYLDNFNEENGTHLESLGAVHFEAMGIYAGKCDDLKNLPEGAKVGVPSDPTNEARALQLLEQEGFVPPELPAGTDAALVAERLAKIVNALRKRDDGKLKKAVLRFFRDTGGETPVEEAVTEE